MLVCSDDSLPQADYPGFVGSIIHYPEGVAPDALNSDRTFRQGSIQATMCGMSDERMQRSARMLWTVATSKMTLLGIAHVVLGFVLYAARIKDISAIFESDLLVFKIPALLTYVGNCCFAWPATLPTSAFPARLGFVALIALVATAVSLTCTLFVAFNIYGT
jgi:hypothetical protein